MQSGNNNFVKSEDVELLKSQATIYNHLFAYIETLALRCAVELRIADIIHSHGHPMTLSEIASKLDQAPSPNVSCLARVMRVLTRKKIFTLDNKSDEGEGKYGLTPVSKCLLHDQEQSLAPTFLTLCCHTMLKPWYEVPSSIREGVDSFRKTHGETIWEHASRDPEFNSLFNVGMAAATKPTLDVVVSGYKEGFSKLAGTLVDVAGGIGELMSKIVEACPHIKGINFDLPHTVADAPQFPGVTHVGGDMFKEIPPCDNVIIKTVLIGWEDKHSLKILRNCQKAISQNKKKGKVIIVEEIIHPNSHDIFDDATIALDLLMMANGSGGKARTEGEWRKLLKEAGFIHINIIALQTIMSLSIIEAFSS